MAETPAQGFNGKGWGWLPWLSAALTTTLVLGGELMVENYQARSQRQHERAHVIDELAQIRARLEGVINANLLSIDGLAAVIAAQPDIDQEGFARIARGILSERSALRNLAAAPDLVVSLIYPQEGNRAALGLDLRNHPTQSEAALRAVETGDTVIAGPLELVEGGTAIIARRPVVLPESTASRPGPVWGLIAAVIDIDELYQLAELPPDGRHEDIQLALRGKDGRGEHGAQFFGDPRVFDADPEAVAVTLPGGSWQLAGVPLAGWGAHAHGTEIHWLRLLGLILALVLGGLVFQLVRNNQRLRQTTAKLETSQAMFQGFMDNLPAGTFVRDPGTGEIVFENRWFRPMHCDVLRFALPDQRRRPLVGGIVMDVSERVSAQHELATRSAQLRSLFDTLPDLVWLKDPDGRYLACNQRLEALFGAQEADIVGRRDHDFVDRELADFFRQNDLAAMQADVPLTNEERVTFASDGHQELLETIKAPVYDQQGTLLGVLGIARDITDRQLTVDALRASAERLEAAESIAHIGNWEYRVADRGIQWSDEVYRLFGLPVRDRAIDHDWVLSRVLPEDRAAYDQYLQRLLDTRPGDEPPEFRCRVERLDGETRVLSFWARIDFDPDGSPQRLFGTVQDVTEAERLRDKLQARLHELSRWQAVMLGREDRVQELKREVNQLLAAQQRPARYPSQSEAS